MKRLLLIFVLSAATIAALSFGLLLAVGYYLSPRDELRPTDAIVAISGGDTNSRTLAAVALYQRGLAPTLIFSGAALDRNGPSNALAMKRLAVEQGVPDSAVLIDETATTTEQNAIAVKAILQSRYYNSMILVTSPYHQRRASIVFGRQLGSGVSIVNHSSPDENWRRSYWWKNSFSIGLTISELQKTIYLLTQKPAA